MARGTSSLSPARLMALLALSLTPVTAAVPSNYCPQSNAIDVQIPGPTEQVIETIQEVHSMLLRCGDITSLKLRITPYTTGEKEPLPGRQSLPFDLEPGNDKYPALRAIDLSGYALSDSEWARVRPSEHAFKWPNWWWSGVMAEWRHWRMLSAEQRDKVNAELWMEAMDFSKLEFLAVRDAGAAHVLREKKLPETLKGLKSLTLTGDEGAHEFFLDLPKNSLLELGWHDHSFVQDKVAEVLGHHAESLKVLSLHHGEAQAEQRPTLVSPGGSQRDAMERLAARVPGLRKLTIDMDADGEVVAGTTAWPVEDLTVLVTKLPDLAELVVYFPLLMGGEGELAQPRLHSAEPVRDVFGKLRKAGKGKMLERLVFFQGDWDADSEQDGMQVKVDCKATGSGVEEVECTFGRKRDKASVEKPVVVVHDEL